MTKLVLGMLLGSSAVLAGAVIYAGLSKAAPFVPPVNTDMACPAIVNGWPDMLGSPDGTSITCFPAPTTPSPVYGTRVQTDGTGLYTWSFPAGCKNASNIPYFNAIAEGPTPQGGVTVNPQIEGVPTATGVSFRVTRTTATVVALLGLTILSVNTPGATYLDLTCSAQ